MMISRKREFRHALEMRNIDRVRTGTTACWFLEELNANDW